MLLMKFLAEPNCVRCLQIVEVLGRQGLFDGEDVDSDVDVIGDLALYFRFCSFPIKSYPTRREALVNIFLIIVKNTFTQ